MSKGNWGWVMKDGGKEGRREGGKEGLWEGLITCTPELPTRGLDHLFAQLVVLSQDGRRGRE